MTKRYFVGVTDACDRFLIPVEHYADWTDFVENEDRWDDGEPAYAEYIDGGTLTFTDPKIERLT